MRRAALGAGILLLVAVVVIAAGAMVCLWGARRSLENRAAWIEERLRVHSLRAALLQDLEWPPYRDYLDTLRKSGKGSQDEREILTWRAAGCPFAAGWTAVLSPGFRNRHWPFIFGVPLDTTCDRFLREAPLAQDLYRGGGFSCSLFRAAEECERMCLWRDFLQKREVSAADLDAFAKMVDCLEAARPPLTDEFEVEHLLRCRDVLEIYRTGKDPENLIRSQKPGLFSLYSRAVLFSQLLGRLEDLQGPAVALASRSPQEIWRWVAPGAEPELPADFRIYAQMNRDVFWREGLSAQRRQLLRTALAIARYGAATGRHPDRLEDLVPTFLPTIPRSPLTGAPLFYGGGTVGGDVNDQIQQWTVKAPSTTR